MSKVSRKQENAWAMYDWANSAYNLVITATIFPAYYVGMTTSKSPGELSYVDFFGFRIINTVLMDYALACVFIIVAFTSPILSSIADYRRNKKVWLTIFSCIGAGACSALFFFKPTMIEYGIVVFAIAALGYWGSLVFYNSYLPDIVPPSERDRVSAKGFALGYVGSVLLQVICLVIIFKPDILSWLGPMSEQASFAVRTSFMLVGIWWFGFAQITLRSMPLESKEVRKERKNVLTNGFRELKLVFKQVREMVVMRRFLFAYFLYSMGVQTVMLVATGFAKKEIFTDPEDDPKLVISVIIIQLIAIVGAVGMSRLSKFVGNINVLIIAVMIWITVCIWAYYVKTEVAFYFVAATVGLVMGGIQSMSRSTFSKLIPEGSKDTTSFFSFYDVSEKIALFIGLFLFGSIEHITHGIRNSILSLVVIFILGLLALLHTRAAVSKEKNAALYN
ncbi:MFS transporter [Pollutibacter soli]|uniref:MFS transporter n=1 Tax=Pollutibacter soli TaxID=3034157 RepID=UPI003013EA02